VNELDHTVAWVRAHGPAPLPLDGWDQASIWGWDDTAGSLYAYLRHNTDDPVKPPFIRIGPDDDNPTITLPEALAVHIAMAAERDSREVITALDEAVDGYGVWWPPDDSVGSVTGAGLSHGDVYFPDVAEILAQDWIRGEPHAITERKIELRAMAKAQVRAEQRGTDMQHVRLATLPSRVLDTISSECLERRPLLAEAANSVLTERVGLWDDLAHAHSQPERDEAAGQLWKRFEEMPDEALREDAAYWHEWGGSDDMPSPAEEIAQAVLRDRAQRPTTPDDIPAWMLRPSWFLVTSLPWPEGAQGMSEAAFAIAPEVTRIVRRRDAAGKPLPLSQNFDRFLELAQRHANATDTHVVFVSDLTVWLTDLGYGFRPWSNAGVDFDAALDELVQERVGLYLTISQRAYAILCSTARELTLVSPSGTEKVQPAERERVRGSFQEILYKEAYSRHPVEVQPNNG